MAKDPEPDDLAPSAPVAASSSKFERVVEGIHAILGAGGRLAELSPTYEERPQQIQMAELVASALEHRHHAVIEAGTGTGKTLAYLVPAMLHGEKVIVSTATKALQEQLVDKDLPLLRKIGAKVKFAVMKGRQNYLCRLRQEIFDAAPTFVSWDEKQHYVKLRTWVEKTETGDRAELELPENYLAWKDVSSTAETCVGQECPRWDSCFVVKMRQKAQEADIVVVNHHLFFADLSLRQSPASKAGVEIIPRHQAVIFDEAHNLEEIATEFFGAQASNWRFFDLCRDAERAADAKKSWPGDKIRRATSALGKSVEAYFRGVSATAPLDVGPRSNRPAMGAPKVTKPPPVTMPEPPPTSLSLFEKIDPKASREISASHEEVLSRAVIIPSAVDEGERRETRWTLVPGALATLKDERIALVDDLRAFKSLFEGITRDAEDPEADGFARRLSEMMDSLDLLGSQEEPGLVYWAEQRGRGVFLRASPIDVAGTLRRTLFSNEIPVVMTSATLATGGDTTFFRRRVGLPSSDATPEEGKLAVKDAVFSSPFDYPRQAAIYVPRHLPDPSADDFLEKAEADVAALIALAKGRTFVLFTSLRSMNEMHRRLSGRIPYRVLLQGQKPKGALIRDFREEPSVLFATQSFWEGVDIQGDQLSMVIIDKLPFASPGDPLVAARLTAIQERGGSSFGEYSLPAAAIALKQGFGRLIRSRQDTGAVAILDRRLWTKGYGGYFRRSLPASPTFERFADLKHWWREIRQHEE